MKKDAFKDIRFKVVRMAEAMYSWRQEVTVPKGYYYRTSFNRPWEKTYADLTLYVEVPGDYVEMVDPDGERGTRYEVY